MLNFNLIPHFFRIKDSAPIEKRAPRQIHIQLKRSASEPKECVCKRVIKIIETFQKFHEKKRVWL